MDTREGRTQSLRGQFLSWVQPLINHFNQLLTTNAEAVVQSHIDARFSLPQSS